MYREVKLRAAIIDSRKLRLLPMEQIYSEVPGVYNLSSDTVTLPSYYHHNITLRWILLLFLRFILSKGTLLFCQFYEGTLLQL